MKANIRLFVPNTTEALDFEYGLVIHYMQNNEVKKGHKIGLQYYELAEIEPVHHALDIVEQKDLTEVSRNQSKIDGFTLDSHYTLSFDQRFNNKIAQDSVRQIWLWLHCKNSTEYPFLLEKITDIEQKMLSQQNQLLVRLWAHADWMEREIQPLAQRKVNSQTELLSVLQQDLSAHFDQIENINRQKALAELNLKTPQPMPATFVKPEEPVAAYKPAPLFGNSPSLNPNAATPVSIEEVSIDQQSQSALTTTDSDVLLEQKMLSILQEYSATNFYTKGNIPIEKFNNAMQSYPVDPSDTVLALIDTTVLGSAKNGMMIGLKGVYFKNDWTTKTAKNFISWKELYLNKSLINDSVAFCVRLMEGCDFNVSASDLKKNDIIEILHKLIAAHEELNFPKKEDEIFEQQNVKNLDQISHGDLEVTPESDTPVYVAIRGEDSTQLVEQKFSTWWIWPLIIFIGFLINPIAGGVLIALAICWYTLKFILSSWILSAIVLLAIAFGIFSSV